jgi:hypothetical protein
LLQHANMGENDKNYICQIAMEDTKYNVVPRKFNAIDNETFPLQSTVRKIRLLQKFALEKFA